MSELVFPLNSNPPSVNGGNGSLVILPAVVLNIVETAEVGSNGSVPLVFQPCSLIFGTKKFAL